MSITPEEDISFDILNLNNLPESYIIKNETEKRIDFSGSPTNDDVNIYDFKITATSGDKTTDYYFTITIRSGISLNDTCLNEITINGSYQQGQILTLDIPADIQIKAYEWYRSSEDSDYYIENINTNTYTLTQADVSNTIYVKFTTIFGIEYTTLQTGQIQNILPSVTFEGSNNIYHSVESLHYDVIINDPDVKFFSQDAENSDTWDLSTNITVDISSTTELHDWIYFDVNHCPSGNTMNSIFTFYGSPVGKHFGIYDIIIYGNDGTDYFEYRFYVNVDNKYPFFYIEPSNTLFFHSSYLYFDISMDDYENAITLIDVSLNFYKYLNNSWELITSDNDWLKIAISESNPNTFNFSGTPDGKDCGEYRIELFGNDTAQDFSSNFYFDISNSPMTIQIPLHDLSFPINIYLSISFDVIDSDDTIGFEHIYINNQSWLSISDDPSFSWIAIEISNNHVDMNGIPFLEHTGTYTVDISASDGPGVMSASFEFIIYQLFPIFSEPQETTFFHSYELSFNITVNYPHFSYLSYNVSVYDSSNSLVSWLTYAIHENVFEFSGNVIEFSGTPSVQDVDRYTIHIMANDNFDNYNHIFFIDISNTLPTFVESFGRLKTKSNLEDLGNGSFFTILRDHWDVADGAVYSHGQDLSFQITMHDHENVLTLSELTINFYKLYPDLLTLGTHDSWTSYFLNPSERIDGDHYNWLSYSISGNVVDFYGTAYGTDLSHINPFQSGQPLAPNFNVFMIVLQGEDAGEEFTETLYFKVKNDLPVFSYTILNNYPHNEDISFELSMIDPESAIDLTDVSVNMHIDLAQSPMISIIKKEINPNNHILLCFLVPFRSRYWYIPYRKYR